MRFKPLEEDEMTEEQLAFYREMRDGPRAGIRGPLQVLLRTPALARCAAQMGEYVRWKSSLPPRISEFAILIAARCWTSQFEWYAHHPLAMKAGLDAQVAAELAQGKRPGGMKPDEEAAYQFCTELHMERKVSDTTFATAKKQLGENGVIDLMGLSGYYCLVSMVLNVNDKELPDGTPNPLPVLGKST
jgi:4-carboxymuconolactone decarboxylase